jgi:hypothetical protein
MLMPSCSSARRIKAMPEVPPLQPESSGGTTLMRKLSPLPAASAFRGFRVYGRPARWLSAWGVVSVFVWLIPGVRR